MRKKCTVDRDANSEQLNSSSVEIEYRVKSLKRRVVIVTTDFIVAVATGDKASDIYTPNFTA